VQRDALGGVAPHILLPHPVAQHLEVQVDGEWLRGGGFEAFGGRHVRRDGKPAAYSSYRVVLPPGVARVARAVLTCDAPIRTRVEIEAT
jgi:hypothetical protein